LPGDEFRGRQVIAEEATGVKAAAIHETAEVSDRAQVGKGTKVWHQAQIRENAKVGANCIIGKGVYVDFDVVIGNNVKIQNGASVYHGVTIEDGVFIGPHACLTNDKYPRAITPSGDLKQDQDWEVGRITVKHGASVGARAVVLPDVVIGSFAMIGAGAVVTRDVPDHGLVQGNPARLVGFVCKCGRRLVERPRGEEYAEMWCPVCDETYTIPAVNIQEVQRDSHS
jgi:UDP-2-acetamido-3-amino-2,3-dideoxy-glucuronate N-acetyltransferase